MITLEYPPGQFTRQFSLPDHPYTPNWTLGTVVSVSPLADCELKTGVYLKNIVYAEDGVTADLEFPNHLIASEFNVSLKVNNGQTSILAIRAIIGGVIEE